MFDGWEISGMKEGLEHTFSDSTGVNAPITDALSGNTYEACYDTFLNLRGSNSSTEYPLTFTAKWLAIIYNIRPIFDNDAEGDSYRVNHIFNPSSAGKFLDGDTFKSQQYYGSTFEISNPSEPPKGYKFAGWRIQGDALNDTIMIGSDFANLRSVNIVNKSIEITDLSITRFNNLTSQAGATIEFVALWTPLKYNIEYNNYCLQKYSIGL